MMASRNERGASVSARSTGNDTKRQKKPAFYLLYPFRAVQSIIASRVASAIWADSKSLLSDDWIRGNPAVPGGSLKSKPTWSNTSWVFDHVGFFRLRSQ